MRHSSLPKDAELCGSIGALGKVAGNMIEAAEPADLFLVGFWGSDIRSPLPDIEALKVMTCNQ